MNTPGAQLAAMRKFTERTCEICGDTFRGRKTTTACPKHQALARKRRQLAKQKEEQIMSIQAQLNQQAFDMLPLTMHYINNEVNDKTWAANLRGMLLQSILNTQPPLDFKSSEELNEFDLDMRNSFYRRDGDERFDRERYERDMHG